MINSSEILQTIHMFDQQHLDIRTITMGISLLDCADPDPKAACRKVYDKICRRAQNLVATGQTIEKEFGIPIVNKRISVTPAALISGAIDDPLPQLLSVHCFASFLRVFPSGLTLLRRRGRTFDFLFAEISYKKCGFPLKDLVFLAFFVPESYNKIYGTHGMVSFRNQRKGAWRWTIRPITSSKCCTSPRNFRALKPMMM